MQYTLILTEKVEGGIQVTIPALPTCRPYRRERAISGNKACLIGPETFAWPFRTPLPRQTKLTRDRWRDSARSYAH